MPQSFKCPSCAAPLEYEGARAQKCPFCGSSVIVDSEIRSRFNEEPESGLGSLLEQAQRLKEVKRLIRSGNKIGAIKEFREIFGCGLKEAKDAVENIEAGRPIAFTSYQSGHPAESPASMEIDGEAIERVVKKISFATIIGATIIGSIVLLIVGVIASSMWGASGDWESGATSLPKSAPAVPIKTIASTPEKPKFAREILKFGGEGIGAGQFKDNRSVAVDGDGNIFSAEYTGGKIQAFDAEGKFKKLLMVDEEKALLDMVADRSGNLFVLMVGVIYRFDTRTGEPRGKIDKFYGEDLAVGLDGLLYATVSPGDVVVMSAEGKEVKRFRDLAGQANLKRASLENITLDGDGNMYIVDKMGYYILKFSKDGKYINRFGGKSESGKRNVKGAFDSFPQDIAVDGKGRLFVSMVSDIQVFDTNGSYMDEFDSTQAFGMTVTDKNELWVACRPYVVKYEIK